MQAKISSLESVGDSHKVRLANLINDLEESEGARAELKRSIQDLEEKMIGMEEDIYEMQNTQLDLVEQLKEMEGKNELAEDKIAELIKLNEQLEKNQAVYIAKKNDRVDAVLGNYLNKFPERDAMKIMFLRESEGVYCFGSRRVYVKVEKGDQIFVRVGGGYMHIDEFIMQYTHSEVEKIERRDVLARFQNKIAV